MPLLYVYTQTPYSSVGIMLLRFTTFLIFFVQRRAQQ